MKIFHNEEIYIKTDNFSDSIFKENTMFFDIETTGFSPVKAIVYMIGCARRIKNRIVIDQYFAESAAEGFLYVIDGASVNCSVRINLSCFQSKRCLCIYRRHTEKRDYPHPEYCAGTAYEYRAARADDVSRADLGGDGSRKRLKRRKSAFLFSAFKADISEDLFHSLAKTAYLNKTCFDRKEQPDADQKDYENIIGKI